MRVLIAPDKFRGTLTAAQAAHAVASGWRRARPSDTLVEVPMADGGEGTLDAMVEALDGTSHPASVHGPLGDPVDAEYGIVSGPSGVTAVVEMARASGLGLIGEARRDPTRTSTGGTGELIRAALGHGPAEVVVCIGGSATNDGGAGLAQALGVRLINASGGEIGPGGASLLELERIDVTGLEPAVAQTRFLVACDVDNPLTGPRGASVVYGPQKGATSEDVLLLDRALGHLAAVIYRDLGLDVRDLAGGGAAGGLGAGMVAFLGAHLRPGVDLVMDAVGLGRRLATADLVVTGEGALDQQSLDGKVPGGVIGAARASGVPAIVLCGRAEAGLLDVPVFDLVGRFGEHRAMTDARAALEDLAEEVGAGLQGLSTDP
ncbi:MAG TPA: glycerate kinase [Actinomycetota bacterium]|nr:glycerate kinase [Actinomycetota bacterium]